MLNEDRERERDGEIEMHTTGLERELELVHVNDPNSRTNAAPHFLSLSAQVSCS